MRSAISALKIERGCRGCAACIACAISGVAVSPVPIAQTGSYATDSPLLVALITSRSTERGLELLAHDVLGAARLALLERLADAQHRAQPELGGGDDLLAPARRRAR